MSREEEFEHRRRLGHWVYDDAGAEAEVDNALKVVS